MTKEESPKIEEVADQESWRDADVVYEFKDGKYVVGLVELSGLENLAKFEMTSQEEDMLFKTIHRFFARHGFKLEEKETPEKMNTERWDKIGRMSRKITIRFSPETPKKYYEEYGQELVVVGEFWRAGQSLVPDPISLMELRRKPPAEGFTEEWHGSVTIYPNNISSKDQLYLTIFHELTHLVQKWQGKDYLLDRPIGAKYGEEPLEIHAERTGEEWMKGLLGDNKKIKKRREK